jgi:hypothetical protein
LHILVNNAGTAALRQELASRSVLIGRPGRTAVSEITLRSTRQASRTAS